MTEEAAQPRHLTVPKLSLVVMIVVSGSGKSTWAKERFLPTEIISSDECRGLVSDDENAQDATNDAFDVLHFIAGKRLARGKLTVIDATNVQPEGRKPLVALARQYHVLPVAVVLNMPEKLCAERNRAREDRDFGSHVIKRQSEALRRSLKSLKREGFRHIHVLSSPEEAASAVIDIAPLWNDRTSEHGPFDIIGDVHGCFDELVDLLERLGYVVEPDPERGWRVCSPEGRKVVFAGDLVDRGPRVVDVLKLAMSMVGDGLALAVPGNHDVKLMRSLKGRDVTVAHGLAESLSQLSGESPEFRRDAADFIDGLISHYVFDDGNLVVAHAGLKESMQGRGSGAVRDFAMYGETTGETDEYGLPVRFDWASEYRGKAIVVYGHTPVVEAEWINRTINIDTGVVFGGKLTALRYPEKELVSVPARRTYFEPVKPLAAPTDNAKRADDVLDIDDVLGKRIVPTRLRGSVTVREENSRAALEVMSRFAADPRWLVYLPPTMSPPETTKREGLLEHPDEAFDYFRHHGVEQVVCEQKHMGSRAIVILCRDAEAAVRRFRIADGSAGIVYTRTGRQFFDDAELEEAFLGRVRGAVDAAGWWASFETEWVALDCELMPWSAKALELLKEQYAAVGSAARLALPQALDALNGAASRGVDVDGLPSRYADRYEAAERFTDAYRQYCWSVLGLDDLRLAPFHVLATEGVCHADKDHLWHMETLAGLAKHDALLLETPYRTVSLGDDSDVTAAIEWWDELTAAGGEGMVVKPKDFIASHKGQLVQPAVKCRGREYLRIIYGPEYLMGENLQRLRDRSVSRKRSLALREFALGIESLERFVRREPLYHVHQAVFAVLAMESEPVDPRL
jgi:protein phosphatase